VDEGADKYHLVGELPLYMQGYRVLDRAGPSGMIQAVCQDPYWHFYSLVILQEFHQYINGLDYRKKRLMLKGLDNSGSVVSVMLDDGSIRKVK